MHVSLNTSQTSVMNLLFSQALVPVPNSSCLSYIEHTSNAVLAWNCLEPCQHSMASCLSCRECSISVTRCLSDSMHDIIKAAAHGAHIPPSVMHSAQDAIAAIYYLLQLHGSFMAASQPDGHEAICAAAEAMITSLKVKPRTHNTSPAQSSIFHASWCA